MKTFQLALDYGIGDESHHIWGSSQFLSSSMCCCCSFAGEPIAQPSSSGWQEKKKNSTLYFPIGYISNIRYFYRLDSRGAFFLSELEKEIDICP